MELRILGPVEIVVEGRSVHLARRQQRLILGILAMEANRLVSRERLTDLVWGGSPPPNARAVLQTRVSEIRAALNKHLDASRLIATRDGGYLLNIAPDRVDVHRFRSLVRSARQTESIEDARRLLMTAAGLWRGPVLGGWLPDASHGSFCASLEEARLTADEDLWEVELRLGNHHLVVDDMAQAAALNPSRERLVGLAMTALHRSGRTAEALRRFEHSQRWLAAELGVGPSAELRGFHLAVLDGITTPSSARPAVPHLLPSVTSSFKGREIEAARTRALLTTEGSSVRLAVVTGPAGVGKTALSIHVAHQVLDHFTDGQLYADLRGDDRQAPPDSAEILARFLRAIGMAHIPDEADERASLYRNLLAGRKVLVILDNAFDASQVRALIPGTASCAVLISSRARLGAALGAASIELKLLDESAAIDLLATLVDRTRVEREPRVAAEIVRLCGGLPLAVRIVAARLNAKSHWALDQLHSRLTDERKRLDHLAYGGLDVRASIFLSYAGLSPDAKSLLCRLGDTGLSDVDVSSSAALLGTDAGDAQEILEELHDARLLDANGTDATNGHHRYRLHDLVRLAAAGRAVTDQSAEELSSARERLSGLALPTP